MTQLTDSEIEELISAPKTGADRLRGGIRWSVKGCHREAQVPAEGADGQQFRVILRQNLRNALDFTAMLAYCPPDTSAVFRLTRYNGKHGEHTNHIERNRFYEFHIHRATERYQRFGAKEDTYAERTTRYATLSEAIECLISDCGFEADASEQPSLFGPEDFQ